MVPFDNSSMSVDVENLMVSERLPLILDGIDLFGKSDHPIVIEYKKRNGNNGNGNNAAAEKPTRDRYYGYIKGLDFYYGETLKLAHRYNWLNHNMNHDTTKHQIKSNFNQMRRFLKYINKCHDGRTDHESYADKMNDLFVELLKNPRLGNFLNE